MTDMLNIIKKAAMEAIENQKPAALMLGTVESEAPLEIRIEQRFSLKAAQLILPRAMTDHEVEIEIDAATESGGDPGHIHEIAGKKMARILNGLRTGEAVLLLRMQGGQKYMILDRVVSG